MATSLQVARVANEITEAIGGHLIISYNQRLGGNKYRLHAGDEIIEAESTDVAHEVFLAYARGLRAGIVLGQRRVA